MATASVLVITALLASITPALASTSNCSRTVRAIRDTYGVLDRLLQFFDAHFAEVNLDGLFSVQVATAELLKEMRALRDSAQTASAVADLVKTLEQRMERIEKKMIPMIRIRDLDYFRHFRRVVAAPLMLANGSRELRDCPRWSTSFRPRREWIAYYENAGDRCLTEVMGTSTTDQRSCRVTDRCWSFMVGLGKRRRAYTVTHALIYLLFLRHFGCKSRLGVDLSQLIHDLSCRVRREFEDSMAYAARTGQLPFTASDDLLLEQETLLAVAGYHSVASDRLFLRLRSLQSVIGCFKPEGTRRGRRRLLRDSAMTDDCSAHMSGLAASYLTIRLRRLLEVYRHRCRGWA